MVLEVRSGFGVNSIFWLRSLADSELGPTRRALEDIQPFFEKLGLPFQLRDARTAAELYFALDSLAAQGIKPILQLDMHGTKEGLVLAGSGELAPWAEVVPRFRAINVTSG